MMNMFNAPYRRHAGVTAAATAIAMLLLSSNLPAQSPSKITSPSRLPATGIVDTLDGQVQDLGAEYEEMPVDLAMRTQRGLHADAVASQRTLPGRPEPLSENQLAALKLPEPEPGLVVPLRGYPTADRLPRDTRPIYMRGSLGLNATARAEAGITGSAWPYDYSAHVEAARTSGFEDNNQASLLAFAADAGYIIGEDYGIFSGGYMGAGAEYTNHSYRLYALDSAPDRNVTAWQIGAHGSNSINRISYTAHGRFRRLGLSDDTLSARETAFEGMLNTEADWKGMRVGGTADLRLTHANGSSISYAGLNAYLRYDLPALTLRGGGSLSTGGNLSGSTVTRVSPMAELRFRPLRSVVLVASLQGGLAQNTLASMLAENPYLATNAELNQQIENIGYSASLRIEPSTTFAARITAARSLYHTYAYFDRPVEGRFSPLYDQATVTRVDADFFWEIGTNNRVAAMATWLDGTVGEQARALPYVPRWNAEAMYTHRMSRIPLELSGTVNYIGQRMFPSASDSTAASSGQAAWLIGLETRYAVMSWFDVTLELENMFHQRYELWQGYRERGFFAALGVEAQF